MVSKNTTYDMIATLLLNHHEIDHDFIANIKIPRSTVQLDNECTLPKYTDFLSNPIMALSKNSPSMNSCELSLRRHRA